jgi:hypothetical protein
MAGRMISGILLLMVFAVSCCNSNKPSPRADTHKMIPDSGLGILVAENIIQDIIIKNPDPDNAWAEEGLKGMHRQALVDSIFLMVYTRKAIAFDFETHEKLTIRQIKALEDRPDFSREKIGKIQFVESWYLHTGNLVMTKRVSSMVLGYETYDSQGEFRGYLPVFRVMMN